MTRYTGAQPAACRTRWFPVESVVCILGLLPAGDRWRVWVTYAPEEVLLRLIGCPRDVVSAYITSIPMWWDLDIEGLPRRPGQTVIGYVPTQFLGYIGWVERPQSAVLKGIWMLKMRNS